MDDNASFWSTLAGRAGLEQKNPLWGFWIFWNNRYERATLPEGNVLNCVMTRMKAYSLSRRSFGFQKPIRSPMVSRETDSQSSTASIR